MTWSIILLKNSYLFKIAELEIFFIQKLIIDSIILNKLEFFSEIVDKWRGLLEDYIISPILGIKKFHISTSTSAIILKIQIKNIFFFFFFSHFLGNQTVQQIQKKMSFQALHGESSLPQNHERGLPFGANPLHATLH